VVAQEAFRHHKKLGATRPEWLDSLRIDASGSGVADAPAPFFAALSRHRHREWGSRSGRAVRVTGLPS